MDHEIAQLSVAAYATAKAIVQLFVEWITEILPRIERANGDDRIDVGARPAGDAQHLINSEPWHPVAGPLPARQPFLVHCSQQSIIVKYGRRCVMTTWIKRQNAH